jgi:hypothetical protein
VQSHMTVPAERESVLEIEASARGGGPFLDVVCGKAAFVLHALPPTHLAAVAVTLEHCLAPREVSGIAKTFPGSTALPVPVGGTTRPRRGVARQTALDRDASTVLGRLLQSGSRCPTCDGPCGDPVSRGQGRRRCVREVAFERGIHVSSFGRRLLGRATGMTFAPLAQCE